MIGSQNIKHGKRNPLLETNDGVTRKCQIEDSGITKQLGNEGKTKRSPFSSGAEDGRDESLVEPAAGAVLQFSDDRRDHGEMPVLLGEDEAAEDAGGD